MEILGVLTHGFIRVGIPVQGTISEGELIYRIFSALGVEAYMVREARGGLPGLVSPGATR